MSNETMAPTLAELNRRNDLQDFPRRRRDGSGAASGGGNKRGNGGSSDYGNNNNNGGGDVGNKGNNKSDDNGNDDNGDDDNGKYGGGPEKDHYNSPPSAPSQPSSPATSTSVVQLPSTPVTTLPTIVVVTSTTGAGSMSSSIWTSIPTLSTTSTLVSSFPITTTTSIPLSTTAFIPSAAPSSEPRKGLTDDDPYSTATKTKNHGNTATALSDTAPSSSASLSLDLPALPKDNNGDGLSPTSEHVLIAFGAIGAFIIFLAAVWFIARMKKIDLFSKARGKEFSKGGPRGWYGFRAREMDYSTDGPPPKYTGFDEGFEYPSEQKAVPAQRQLEAFYSPTNRPTLATPESAAALARSPDTQRQDTVREALLDNPAPFGASPAQPMEQSTTQAFYNLNQSYNPNPTFNPNLTYNSNATTAGLSRQNSDAYDPAQREVNHMSYLSSLSSGFGDQIIIPEPLPTKANNAGTSRQSYRHSRKLSWGTSARGRQGDRDTVYTTASIDSEPPRFRSVNSWVSQQVGRVQKQQTQDEVPAMPEIPKPLRAGVDHQRKPSEDPAFRHHPGDEIEFSRGSRIPSTILDKKFGIS